LSGFDGAVEAEAGGGGSDRGNPTSSNARWDFDSQKKMFSAGGPGIELLLVAWFGTVTTATDPAESGDAPAGAVPCEAARRNLDSVSFTYCIPIRVVTFSDSGSWKKNWMFGKGHLP
jgi:hypothetical protein